MIAGLAHVCFSVPNLDRTVEFYCDVVGLQLAFEHRTAEGRRKGVYLKVGPRTFLEIFQGKPDTPPAGEEGFYRHICLEVVDIQATVQRLRGRGVEVSDAARGKDQSLQAWLKDPDGNRIELHEYTPESWQAPWL